MINGLVSCIIPTYKRNDTLLRAINSVLEQTYKNLEVIVVDDNEPNDDYSKIVQKKLSTITDKRVRYIQQDKHINGAAARNVGIRASKGEFIAFLDDDDEWLVTKIEKQVMILKESNEYGAVSCLYTYYDNGNPIRKAPHYTTKDLHLKVLNRSVSILTSTVLFRKEALDKSGYFDESFIRHQDLQLFLDFLKVNKMQVLSEYDVKIHIDEGGNRPNSIKMIKIKEHFLKKMEHHFNLYDNKTQKRIYSGHYFEIIFLLIKEKRFLLSIRYLLKIGFNPTAYYDVFKRLLGRRKNKN
ncbi:glycosyltransferase family 2 protein [Gracilibacillus sp. HCP3S3_G5_1]|uniref:glycosyltransferase family 2 protein n=1 Tax=unclassified Gracilibacillus TaxID=2625209 RepID=UPI003F8C6786